jgi:hypothetical protein
MYRTRLQQSSCKDWRATAGRHSCLPMHVVKWPRVFLPPSMEYFWVSRSSFAPPAILDFGKNIKMDRKRWLRCICGGNRLSTDIIATLTDPSWHCNWEKTRNSRRLGTKVKANTALLWAWWGRLSEVNVYRNAYRLTSSCSFTLALFALCHVWFSRSCWSGRHGSCCGSLLWRYGSSLFHSLGLHLCLPCHTFTVLWLLAMTTTTASYPKKIHARYRIIRIEPSIWSQ